MKTLSLLMVAAGILLVGCQPATIRSMEVVEQQQSATQEAEGRHSATLHEPAYPLFKALVADPNASVRQAAIIALGEISPAVPAALADLAELLTHKELGGTAAEALERKEGVPTLIKALDHADPLVRNRAVYALPWIPFDDALPALLAALDHRDAELRNWAVRAVLDIQSRGVDVARDEVVDALTRRLADDDDDTRRTAATALLNLKAAAVRAKPALLKAANGASFEQRAGLRE